MSSFIEDGASDISAFASIPLNDAFRRLPTNTHTFIDLSKIISIMMFQYEVNPARIIPKFPAGQGGKSGTIARGTNVGRRDLASLAAEHCPVGKTFLTRSQHALDVLAGCACAHNREQPSEPRSAHA